MARSSLVLILVAAGCAQEYYSENTDYDMPPPDDLDRRVAAFRSGEEKWHGDPRKVADVAIRENLRVPWSADPYRAREYEILNNEKWGDYVVRGYSYPNGQMRYRVKVRRYQEIWYSVQVSHYKRHEVPDDRGHGHSH